MSNTHTTRERFVGQVCTADRGGALQKKNCVPFAPPSLICKTPFHPPLDWPIKPGVPEPIKMHYTRNRGAACAGKMDRPFGPQPVCFGTHTHTAGKRTLKPLCSCGQLVSEVCKMRCDNWPLDWAPTDRPIDPVRECCANNSCKRPRWVCQAVTQGAQLLVHGNHAGSAWSGLLRPVRKACSA